MQTTNQSTKPRSTRKWRVAGWTLVLLAIVGLGWVARVGMQDEVPLRWLLVAIALLFVALQAVLFRWSVSGTWRGVLTIVFLGLIGTTAAYLGQPLSPLAWSFGSPQALDSGEPDDDESEDESEAAKRREKSKSRPALPPIDSLACAKLVHPTADVDDLASGYAPDVSTDRLLKLLQRRYPDAQWIVEQLGDRSFFETWIGRGKGDWPAAMTDLSTAVHESAHMQGLKQRQGRQHTLVLGRDRQLTFPIPTSYDRSQIKDDLSPEVRALSYTATYLEGDSGAQGIEMVLDELNAYIHSLLTAIAVADQLPRNMRTSSRDGLLVFQHYTILYLRRARLHEPKTYEAIKGGPIRKTIVELFDQADCVVSLSQPRPGSAWASAAALERLGISDELLVPLVESKKARDEIERLR